jgi:PAS domain S-box-containing protein
LTLGRFDREKRKPSAFTSSPPLLGETDRENLVSFFLFYDENRNEIDSQLLPIYKSMMKNSTTEEILSGLESTARLQRAAVLEGDWNVYLRNLQALGEWYAQGNLSFDQWVDLFHGFRQLVLSKLMATRFSDAAYCQAVILGMEQFLAIIMSPIWQAYTGYISEKEAQVRLFSSVVEFSEDAILTKNTQGYITSWNAAAERFYGYSAQEAIGQRIDLVVPADRLEELAGISGKLARGESLRNFETVRIDREGRRYEVSLTLSPIKDASGDVVGGSAIVRDVSERNRMLKSLEFQTQELQRSNKELEQFAYVASHDLQEPLRMVASFTELLAERYQGNLDERADKYIRYIVEGAKRMQQLVNDLLAFSRVGTQGKPLRPTDSQAIAMQAVDGLRATMEETDCEIVCDGLPLVNADETQLRQIFQNLIGNALKFRADRPPRIRISAEPAGKEWRFSVADNGIGIEKQYSEQIFQMFQRLHGRDEYEGNGIGLAISKKITERHGGKIWFESAPGEGTTFYFTMPDAEKGSES